MAARSTVSQFRSREPKRFRAPRLYWPTTVCVSRINSESTVTHRQCTRNPIVPNRKKLCTPMKTKLVEWRIESSNRPRFYDRLAIASASTTSPRTCYTARSRIYKKTSYFENRQPWLNKIPQRKQHRATKRMCWSKLVQMGSQAMTSIMRN